MGDRAREEHERFLRRHGLDTDTLKGTRRERKNSRSREFWTGYKAGLREGVTDRAVAPLSNLTQGLDRRSVEKKTNLKPPGSDASPQEVQAYRDAVRLSKATAPLYSKGGYQLITPGTDLTGLGRKL